MRTAFFVLLALNLVYLAWAQWLDAPNVPAARASAHVLPQLVLASEQLPGRGAGEGAGARAVAAVGGGTTSAAPSPERCVSVGPFDDLTRAARGAALLRERGFTPQQRAEEGETWAGFWVYIGGLKSAAEESTVLRTLRRAGIDDAHAMPEESGERRVSVGLFSERARAEKRADAVKRLGLNTQIVERRQPGTVYWVDIDLGPNDRSVPTEGLLSLEDTGSRLEIRVCPGASSPQVPTTPASTPPDARPAGTTTDAHVPQHA